MVVAPPHRFASSTALFSQQSMTTVNRKRPRTINGPLGFPLGRKRVDNFLFSTILLAVRTGTTLSYEHNYCFDPFLHVHCRRRTRPSLFIEQLNRLIERESKSCDSVRSKFSQIESPHPVSVSVSKTPFQSIFLEYYCGKLYCNE